jgi:hypothetical protein
MEEEAEVLDWGNEDDELQLSSEAFRAHLQKSAYDTVDEAEDAVSLGSHEDDQQDVSALDGDGPQEAPKKRPSSPKQQSTPTSRGHHREHSTSSQRQRSPQQSPQRSHSFSKITHALPPKPVVSHVPFVEPFNASIIEATAMSWRTDRDSKKANGSVGKPISSGDSGEPLPPDWECRQPRSGARGVYFYNVRTHESTWTRPVFIKVSSTKDKEKSRSQAPESRRKAHDHAGLTNSPEHITTSRSARPDIEVPAKDLSYEDRHYRPGGDTSADSGKREERPQRAYTPPPSPKVKPVERPKDAERPRPRRSSPPLPKTSSNSHDLQRDSQRESSQAQVSSKDRHWSSSRETVHLEDPTRYRPTPPRPDVAMPSSVHPAYEDRNFRNDGELSSSAPSTLSASSSHHNIPTSRVRRFYSSRGGGRIIYKRLAKPRELSRAASCPLLLYSASSSNPLKDAHHGSLCSSLFIIFSPISQFVPFLFSNLSPFFLLSRTQISAAAYS